MNFLDDLMDEIDIVVLNTKTDDNIKLYEKLVRTYQIEKSFQYPLFYRLQKWKKFLNEQEINIYDMKIKSEFLQNYLERTIIEVDCIKQEYQFILKENQILKDRIDCIIKIPTITDYAQVIKQTKVLQHQIDIWTKRVNIAEVRFCFKS